MGETGKTVVRLTTDETGRVVKTAIVTSSGSTRLDTAAVNAVQPMRCKPYMDNGRAVAVTAAADQFRTELISRNLSDTSLH
jgi:protein TonB